VAGQGSLAALVGGYQEVALLHGRAALLQRRVGAAQFLNADHRRPLQLAVSTPHAEDNASKMEHQMDARMLWNHRLLHNIRHTQSQPRVLLPCALVISFKEESAYTGMSNS
jgi:hypothetical protein